MRLRSISGRRGNTVNFMTNHNRGIWPTQDILSFQEAISILHHKHLIIATLSHDIDIYTNYINT